MDGVTKWLQEEPDVDKVNEHVAVQSDLCDPKARDFDGVFRIEDGFDQIEHALKKWSDVEFDFKSEKGEIGYSHHNKKAKKVYDEFPVSDKDGYEKYMPYDVQVKIWRAYKTDFDDFGYDYPEKRKTQKKACPDLPDDSLWRRCFCSRFGHPKLTGVRSWRALYFQEDARELRLTTSSAPPDLRHLYAQMQAAKRAQPPETHDDALLTLTDAENVTRWRAQRGLSDGSDPASRHTCSIANGCSYRRFGADIFVCEGTGRAHMCDDSCRERVVDMDGMSEMCSISGRSFDRFLGEGADGMATGAMDGGAGEVGFTGERGWLGRAFEAGYGASSEREMYAALWGGDGSAGMRANRGLDSDDEVGSDSSDYDSES